MFNCEWEGGFIHKTAGGFESSEEGGRSLKTGATSSCNFSIGAENLTAIEEA